MDSIKLKISIKDWLYIILIGAFFGFLISLFFLFLDDTFKHFSTIIFVTSSAIIISFFAFILITLSNDIILPRVKERFWYIISFLFSFASGFLGLSFSFYIFNNSGFKIVEYVLDIWIYLSIITGFLTFLIGLILHQFISMKYKNEIVNSQILQSKIKTLENELNPHFLFNALNSISELIYLDKKKAEKATLDLSKFLRNAINKESLISLEAELKMVQTYLDIENIRFDDNIKLDIKLQNVELKSIQIPKFSIQLLVENAIKHGYISKNLLIQIEVSKKEIIVSNNGKITDKINFGTGLNNLQKRLNLLKIGKLEYKTNMDKMLFVIKLKNKGKV